MLGKIPAARLALIEKIVAHALKSVPGARRPLTREFLGAFFRGVAEEDLRAHRRVGPGGRGTRPPGIRTPAHAAARCSSTSRTPLAADASTASHRALLRVVAPDMPFLVDSIGIVFSQMNIAVHLIVHPVLAVRRDSRGALKTVGIDGDSQLESWQMMEIDRPRDSEAAAEIERRVRAALEDVRRAVADFRAMLERVRAVANELDRTPLPVPKSHASEARALLAWMHDGHFVFLGYRHYQLKRGRSRDALVRDGASGLGILRSRKAHFTHPAHRAPATAGTRARAPGAHQGQHAIHRASWQLPRLRRREDLRRFRPGERRASLPRPVDFERLSQAAGGNSLAPPQARRGHRAFRPAGAKPRRQVRGQRHRDLPARRTVPDSRGRAHRQRARHRQSLRAAPRAPVRAP